MPLTGTRTRKSDDEPERFVIALCRQQTPSGFVDGFLKVETRSCRVSSPIWGSRKTEGFVGKGGATERASFRACAEASDAESAPTRRQIGLKLGELWPPETPWRICHLSWILIYTPYSLHSGFFNKQKRRRTGKVRRRSLYQYIKTESMVRAGTHDATASTLRRPYGQLSPRTAAHIAIVPSTVLHISVMETCSFGWCAHFSPACEYPIVGMLWRPAVMLPSVPNFQ